MFLILDFMDDVVSALNEDRDRPIGFLQMHEIEA